MLGEPRDARVGAKGRKAWAALVAKLLGSVRHDLAEHSAERKATRSRLVGEGGEILLASHHGCSSIRHDADATSDAIRVSRVCLRLVLGVLVVDASQAATETLVVVAGYLCAGAAERPAFHPA